MKRVDWWILTFVVVAVVGWLARVESYPTGKQVVFTNEMIPRTQNKTSDVVVIGLDAHGAMKDQEERIHTLMSGFVRGDPKVIQEQTGLISGAVGQAIKDYPPPTGQESFQWKLMVAVTEQAHLMTKTAKEGNFRQAYIHFVAMTDQCIGCHQLRRSWGVLPTPPPQEPAKAATPQPAPAEPPVVQPVPAKAEAVGAPAQNL